MGTAPRQTTAMTPLAAVAGGFLAGVAGTASMDTVRYLMTRRTGAQQSPLRWDSGRSTAGTTPRPRVRSPGE
jgi:hypothetical protein